MPKGPENGAGQVDPAELKARQDRIREQNEADEAKDRAISGAIDDLETMLKEASYPEAAGGLAEIKKLIQTRKSQRMPRS